MHCHRFTGFLDISIRALRRGDLPVALEIQAGAYPAFLCEPEAAFASRLDLASSYCLAATRGEVLVAYLLAYGWRRQDPAPVGTVLGAGVAAEVLFLHDLAVSSAGRRSGIGRRLVARAFELAARDGLVSAELIAVDGAASYWRGLGFAEADIPDALARKVAAYGTEARWMTREIPSLPAGHAEGC